ncbi:MAG: FIST N-terminal domain-containing protein [Candidatus Binatia bacterium]|nr:FIST N-terminal domain-containing protein [Candidatus Binatia bacterium]
MLVARSSASRKADPDAAAREVADGLAGLGGADSSRAAVFFATDDYGPAFERISRLVSTRAGIGSVIGCSAGSVISRDPAPSARGISALAVGGLTGVERFFIQGLRGRSEQYGREIGRLAAGDDAAPATILLLADSYNLAPEELLSGIAETAGDASVIGAGATESGAVGQTAVVGHGTSSTNAVAGLVLRGVSVAPIRSPVFSPIGRWWTITQAEANRVERLDGRPALECVLEALPPSLRENPDEALGFIQVALAESDSVQSTDAPLLRPIVGADAHGDALLIGDEVVPGMRFALAARDPAVARERLDSSVAKLSAMPSLSAVLYFHSALGDSAPYGLPDLDTAYLRRDLAETPIAGFGSYVTFAPHLGRNRFHHFTGLLAGLAPDGSISEEDPNAGKPTRR